MKYVKMYNRKYELTDEAKEVLKMIKEIAMGVLGKKEVDRRYDLCFSEGVEMLYSYDDGTIRLEFERKGFSSKYTSITNSCRMFINGNSVYPAQKVNLEVINALRQIYKKHLQKTKEVAEEAALVANSKLKKETVTGIFRFAYPDGYTDDKITITNIKRKEHRTYSSTDDEYYYTYSYSGKISLLNGTVLCDLENDIYHPGKWEDYVINLVKEFRLEEERMKNENNLHNQMIRQRKEEFKKKIYEKNHAPIDDSKYFRG